MMKRALAVLLVALLLFPSVLTVHADSNYNDTIIDWSEHTTHVYDDCGDLSCNVCGALRQPGHVYDHACDADCNYCGFVRPISGHQYEYSCDADCNLCGEIRPIQHVYVNCYDETCNLCGEVREAGTHVFDNSLDLDCNLCGTIRNLAAIVTQPQSICVEDGAEVVVTFTATGDGLTYRWYWAKKGATKFSTTSFGVGNRYTTTMNSTRNGYQIYCVITDEYGNSLQTETVTINMLPHTYTAKVTKQPTCTATGVMTYTCVCGDSYTESIAALGHTWNAATCTAPKTCAICGATSGEALGHSYTSVVTKQPTCTAIGVKTYTCSTCSDSYTESIAALGHTWNAATCTAPKTCATCGTTEGVALGHTYDNACDTDCNRCGAIRIASDHIYDNACDANCNVCEALRQVPDHVYDNGNDTECNVCGSHRDACRHQYDNACDATCNVPGCGYIRQVGDHIYDNSCDPTCNVCGALRSITHQYADATCTAPKTCTVCGATEGEALGHAYTGAVTYPDCVNGGYTTYTCAACGDSYVTDKTEALGHSYTSAVTKQPTCTATGVKSYTCSNCSDSYTESIAALGHTWNAATCTVPKTCATCGATEGAALGHSYTSTVTKQPTCTATGVKTYTCSNCSDSYTESIAALGHTWNDATCTTPKTCATCGATEGSALGHSYDNACDATCDICGESREVNDHVWESGACSACGVDSPSKATITKEPSTGYAKMGEKVTVKVTAEGEGLTYTWHVKNVGGSKYSKSSITKSSYSVTMSDKVKDRLVFCRVYDKYGNMVQCKTVRLREAVSITKEPSSAAAYAQTGKKVSVKITAAGDGLKYQWYIKNDGATKYSKSSVTSATYSATMGSKVKGRRVYCIVTDAYGKTVQSKTFILRESVSIVAEPKTVTVANNKTAKVTVKASGDGLKYQWYIKNEGQTKYSKSSVTSATYSTTMNSKSKNRLIYCVVTDKYGNTVKTVTVRLKMK